MPPKERESSSINPSLPRASGLQKFPKWNLQPSLRAPKLNQAPRLLILLALRIKTLEQLKQSNLPAQSQIFMRRQNFLRESIRVNVFFLTSAYPRERTPSRSDASTVTPSSYLSILLRALIFIFFPQSNQLRTLLLLPHPQEFTSLQSQAQSLDAMNGAISVRASMPPVKMLLPNTNFKW